MICRKSFIEYMIECYKNFPELLEIYPEDELKKRLEKNIKKIKRCKVNKKYAGYYICRSKVIRIANKNKLDIDKIKASSRLTMVATHESIHALFKRLKDTGCEKSNHLPSVLKRVKVRYKNRYKGVKGLIDFLKKCKNDNCIGRAINEGFTEWVSKKCVDSYGAYELNRQLIELVELKNGTKETLKIGKGNFKEIRNLFKMNRSEFFEFMAELDLYQEIDYKSNEKKLSEEEKNLQAKLSVKTTKKLVDSLGILKVTEETDFSKKGLEKYFATESLLESIFYSHLDNGAESFEEMFPEFKAFRLAYAKNVNNWLADYNDNFEELSEDEIWDIQYKMCSFDIEQENFSEMRKFINKINDVDQKKIDEIKEKIKNECMNKEQIDLVKVNEIINSVNLLNISDEYCKKQVMELLLGKKLNKEETQKANSEFVIRVGSYVEEENSDLFEIFDKNKFLGRSMSNMEEEYCAEVEAALEMMENDGEWTDNIEEIREDIEENEDLDDEDLDNTYDYFGIVGRSIYKYQLKLSEIAKKPIKYLRKKILRRDIEDGRE